MRPDNRIKNDFNYKDQSAAVAVTLTNWLTTHSVKLSTQHQLARDGWRNSQCKDVLERFSSRIKTRGFIAQVQLQHFNWRLVQPRSWWTQAITAWLSLFYFQRDVYSRSEEVIQLQAYSRRFSDTTLFQPRSWGNLAIAVQITHWLQRRLPHPEGLMIQRLHRHQTDYIDW